jgi:hypothetical protein
MQVTKQQVQEWIEAPPAKKLLELAQQELEEIKDTPVTDCLIFGKPHLTHENLVELEARERAWEILVALLGGDWDYFMEEDSEHSEATGTDQ